MSEAKQRDKVAYTTTYRKFMTDFDDLCDKHGLWRVDSRGELDDNDETVLHIKLYGVEDDVY